MNDFPPRTDHSSVIDALRDLADDIGPVVKHLEEGSLIRENLEKDIVASIAIADLLEIHDATGINLHQAPGLLRFVEEGGKHLVGEFHVDDNHA